MTIKMRSNLLVGLLVILPLFFNNCSPAHNEGSFNGVFTASSKCDVNLLEQGFKPYHTMLRQKCSSCHFTGGIGNGPFADVDIQKAFSTFKLKTESKIFTYATDPNHKPPSTGTSNVALLQPARQNWESAMATYNECMADAPPPPPPQGSGNGPTVINTPMIRTIAKTLDLPPGQNRTYTWRLSDELVNPALGFTGATLLVDIQGYESGSNRYVVVSSPQIWSGGRAIFAKNLGLYLDGVFVPPPSGATFQTVERFIPANSIRVFMDSGGAMVVLVPRLTAVEVAFAFEKFEPPTLDGFAINFDPPTFGELISTRADIPAVKRVFANHCIGCHNQNNQASGIDLSDLNSLRNAGSVVPFKPESSLIYLSIEAGRMPKGTGRLSTAERDAVRYWILDGAR